MFNKRTAFVAALAAAFVVGMALAANDAKGKELKGMAPGVILTSPCAYDMDTFVDLAKSKYGVTLVPNYMVTDGVFHTTDSAMTVDPGRVVKLHGEGYIVIVQRFTEADSQTHKWCMLSAHRPYSKEEIALPNVIRYGVSKGSRGGDAS